MADFDELSIKINLDLTGASPDAIQGLTNNINDLKTAAKGSTDLDNLSAAFEKMGTAISALKDSQVAVTEFATALPILATALQPFSNASQYKTQIEGLADSLGKLGSIAKTFTTDSEGFEKATSAFKGIDDKVKGLGNISVPADAKKNLDDLADATRKIGPQGTRVFNFASGLRTLDRTLKQADFKATPEQLENLKKSLMDLNNVVKVVDKQAATSFKKLADGIKLLSKADLTGLNTQMKAAAQACNEFISEFGRGIPDEEIEKFYKLSDALGKVAEGYTKLNAAKQAAGSVAGSDDNGFGAIFGSLSGSIGQIPIVGKLFGTVTKDVKMFQGAVGAAEGATGALAGVLGTLAIALAAVAAAITAVIGLVKFVNSQFEKITSVIQRVASSVQSVLVKAFDMAKQSALGVANTLKSFVERVSGMVSTIKVIGGKVGTLFDKLFGSFSRKIKKGIDYVINTVKRMALRKIINALFKDIAESFNGLVEYSRQAGTQFAKSMDMFATSAAYLDNSIVAAVSPIINAVMPILDAVIDKIVEVINVFNQLFAFLTGASMWTKAIKEAKKYGEEVGGAAKKQKDLNATILGFDEINKLNGDKGGSGGSGVEAGPFKEMPFDEWLNNIKDINDLFDALNEKLKTAVGAFKGFLKGIDWKTIKQAAYDIGHGVMMLLNTIFADKKLGKLLGDTLAQSINTAVQFAKGAVEEWDASGWAEAFAGFIKHALNGINWSEIRTVLTELGAKLAIYLNTLFGDEGMWRAVGRTIKNGINSAIAFASTFLNEFSFDNLAKGLGILIDKAFNGIEWERLGQSLVNGINKLFKSIPTFTEQFSLVDIVTNLGVAIQNSLANIQWNDITTGIKSFIGELTSGINALAANKGLWEEVGKTIAHLVNEIKGSIASFWKGITPTQIGDSLGKLIANYFSTRQFKGAFKFKAEFPQRILSALAAAIEAAEPAAIARSITQAIMGGVEAINIDQISADFSTIAKNLGGAFLNFLSEIKPTEIAEKIGGVISAAISAAADFVGNGNVDWESIGKKFADGINTLTDSLFSDENSANTSQVLDAVTGFLRGIIDNIDWKKLQTSLNSFIHRLPLEDLWAVLARGVINLWNSKKAVVLAWLGEQAKGIVKGLAETLKQEAIAELQSAGQDMGSAIKTGLGLGLLISNPVAWVKSKLYTPIWDSLCQLFGVDPSAVASNKMKGFGEALVKGLYDGLSTWDSIKTELEEIFYAFRDKFEEIKTTVTSKVEELKNNVRGKLETLKSEIDRKWENIKSAARTGWSNIASAVYSAYDTMKTTLLNKFDILKSNIETKWNTIKTNATTAWNGIKDAIVKPISSAYDSLKGVFDKIGKLFEKQFKLDIKLPTIETEEGEDGKPKFKVKWNATAMQTGRILKNATIFGMDNNGLLGGGEAGPEAIVGVNSLSTMIQRSVTSAFGGYSMASAVESGVRSAMQGNGNTAPIVDVTLQCDAETLYRMVKQGQESYNGRYHIVEDFA
jgi:phage-related protein